MDHMKSELIIVNYVLIIGEKTAEWIIKQICLCLSVPVSLSVG